MTYDQTSDHYRHAVEIARMALSDDPRAGVRYPGYASDLGDIAAHLVAVSALRRTNWGISKAIAKHVDAGREAIAQLSLHTDDPAPTAVRAGYSSTGVSGTVGSAWSLNSGHLNHHGETWLVSNHARGLFREYPNVHPDYERMTQRYRDELRGVGVPEAVVARAAVRQGRNPHGGPDDGRMWTTFRVPMEDGRLDHEAHMVHLVHQSSTLVGTSMHTYARQALAVHLNQAQLGRMANAAEMLALDAVEHLRHVEFGEVWLHAVHVDRGLKMKDSAVFHVEVSGLSSALRQVPMVAVMTGEIGLASPTTSSLPDVVKEQQERSRALGRLGGPTIDRTGRLFMEAAEHVPSDLIDALARNVVNVETRLHAGYGTKAWFKISNGRITAAVDISAEVRWKHDHLEIRRTLPETVVATLPGKPASVVMDHPALAGITIRTARMKDGRLIVGLPPVWEMLDGQS